MDIVSSCSQISVSILRVVMLYASENMFVLLLAVKAEMN